MTAPIRVDLDEIGFALEDASFEHENLLDRETGDVLMVLGDAEDEETRRRIDAHPDRYVPVPPADSVAR